MFVCGEKLGEGNRMGNGRTGIHVTDYYFGTLVGEEAGTFCADALSAAGDDGDLACEHALRVIEMARHLGQAILGRHCAVWRAIGARRAEWEFSDGIAGGFGTGGKARVS